MKYVLAYLVIMNATGFLFMLIDKQKAKAHKWRIPESVLLGIAVVGGSLGSLLGMKIFRHKTRHLKFTLGLPLILAVQIMITIFVYM